MSSSTPPTSDLPATGVYVIEIELPEPLTVSVGKLGALDFPAGAYLYVGSAQRALPSRVARHMRREKPLRWHIDYLTTRGRVTAVKTWPHAPGRECDNGETVEVATNDVERLPSDRARRSEDRDRPSRGHTHPY